MRRVLAPGRRALALTHQVVIEDELVAIGHQQVGGGLLDADTDHLLGVFTELGDQGREVRIAADDDEGVDMGLGVAEIERIDHHADVGRVLARLAHMRNFDQLEVGFVHGGFETLVALPVAIGLLHHDAPLEQQTLQDRLDVELVVLGVAHAQGHILEIAEQRHADVVVGRCHGFSLMVATSIITRNPWVGERATRRASRREGPLPDKNSLGD
jgi:hypothetical protein